MVRNAVSRRPGVRAIGAASFLADLGHEIPTALLPGLLTGTLGVVPNTLVHPGLLGGWGCQALSPKEEIRMKLHGIAAFSWHGRRRLALRVSEGWTLKAAAEAGVSACAVRASG